MGDNVKQHHAFRQGLKAFDDYVDGIRYGKEGFRWDGMKFRQLLDGFCQGEEGLYKHLGEEIVTFERLEEYGDKIDWKRWNARTNKKAVGDADFVSLPSRFLMSDHVASQPASQIDVS